MFIENFNPYLACGNFYENGAYVFLTPEGVIEFRGVDEIIHCILPKCDGNNNLNDIIEQSCKNMGFSEEEVDEVFRQLITLGIIVNKNSIFTTSMKYSQNPMLFFQSISEKEIMDLLHSNNAPDHFSEKTRAIPQKKTFFMDLLEKRHSTRTFSGHAVSEKDLSGLLWSTYGIQEGRTKKWKYGHEKTYTVPSGGAIFPLVIYLLCIKESDSLTRGLYRWDNAHYFLRLEKQCSIHNVLMTIDGIETFENATAVMIICADFIRASAKYANKAYPLVLLEAGHAMQNAYLYSAENGIDFVEVLGFHHERLLNEMKINKTLQPLVVGVIGGKQ